AGLIPEALRKPGHDRDAAEAALRYLAGQGHEARILETASRWGADARAGVEAVLAFDPLDVYPSRLPKMPELWDASAFTRPKLVGGAALPLAAVETLGAMLAFSTLEEPYAGLAEVRAACTPASLSAFAWDLFSAWQTAGWPSKDGWAFRALGLLGDDEVA